MSYKPQEHDWLSYLYGELEGVEREKVEQYLLTNAAAREEYESFKRLRGVMSSVSDKEVIAPPIFVGDNSRQVYFWQSSVFKTVMSIAATLLLLMIVGRLTDIRVSTAGNQFTLSFGEPTKPQREVPVQVASINAEDVQKMINTSLQQNNAAMQTSWNASQEKLDASIRHNLATNSGKIDRLVREASTASQDQIRSYVTSLQTENVAMVKNYFELTNSEQKEYIENLLVDFAKYLKQQRNDDLQLVETRLNSLEQNTSVFKEETQQILSSIITTVGAPVQTKETKY
ncbi:anti-sigma factor family protein [Pseudochryseolinea flava]|uniref:Anti-sigma factor n=1 Tax=Pseudochryseolinea flava TaxID=2059302 RepID=A0A364XXU2_9BACT|nr:hypothetical protein [Pseudochryseolinea flava]RAV98808.1 hypothetical protein DQQ10_22600 [Pseudochryseolinea flava]